MTAVLAKQDPQAFERLTTHVRMSDPSYAHATVETIAIDLRLENGMVVEPPEGCLFVRANVGGRMLLLTVQEGMLEGPKTPNEYRVTPAMVEAEITRLTYSLLTSGKTIICEITLRNGYVVRGDSSVVDVTNFDYRVGCEMSRRKAYDRVYEALSFRVQDALHAEREAKGIQTQ